MTARRVLLPLLLCAIPLLAQEHPNIARGFTPEHMYDFSAIDSVNMFNGNMTLRLPIGPELRANGVMPYRLTLAYNSGSWDFIDVPEDPPQLTAIPRKRSNAGMGWSLSLGRLIDPLSPEYTNENGWSYESPDGATHTLYSTLHGEAPANGYTYSRDSSYIRGKQSEPVYTIELADGIIQTFTELAPQMGTWPTAPNSTHIWRLTSMTDRTGNSIAISYSSTSAYTEIWTITDGPRTTTVYFTTAAALGLSTSFSGPLAYHADFQAFGGGTATWQFTYDAETMPPGNGNTENPASVRVAMLISVTPPAGGAFTMVYDDTSNNSAQGTLTGLTLPTGGTVQWVYQASIWAPDSWEKQDPNAPTPMPPIVSSRSFGGGTWNYGTVPGSVFCRRSCPGTGQLCDFTGNRQLTAWTTAPDGTTTLSYFSVGMPGSNSRPRSDICQNYLLIDKGAYGLPFTTSDGTVAAETFPSNWPAPDPAKNGDSGILNTPSDLPRYLSTDIRTGFIQPTDGLWNGFGRLPQRYGNPAQRSTWVTYDHELIDPSALNTHDLNARQTSTLTQFDDDTGCGSAICYSGERFFDFDHYGHFQQSSGLGNFPGSSTRSANFRTAFTNYDMALDSAGDWVLGTFSEQCTVDESSQRTMPITVDQGCSALPTSAAHSLSSIDRTTGQLLARRTKDVNLSDGSTSDNNDLLAVFDYLPADHGLVSHEKYYGGDVHPLSSASGFTTGGNPGYELDHTYTFGGNVGNGGTLTKVQSQYSGASFFTDDVDLDPSTGLVSAARDSAGLQTSYLYDTLGRLTTMTPPATRPTGYTYTNASGANGPSVLAQTTSPTGGSITNKYLFDVWGRLGRVNMQMYNTSSSAVVTQFDALGRKTSVGMPEILADNASPSHVTTFTYDSFGRTTEIKQPDQNSDPENGPVTTTRISYAGARQVVRTVNIAQSPHDADAVTTEVHDALGRLYSVTEQSDQPANNGGKFTTTYDYDVGDRLIKVASGTSNQSNNQSRAFTYDGRGFLLSETHPEKGASGNGTTLYQVTSGSTITDGYDARGHAHRRIDGSVDGPFDVSFLYDGAERLITVEDPDPASNASPKARRTLKQFTFATANSPANCTDTSAGACDARNGKLLTGVRHNYLPAVGDLAVTDTWQYTGLGGRSSQRDTSVASGTGFSGGAFRASQTWNDLGLVGVLNYPARCTGVNCSMPDQRSVTNTYLNGFLTGVTGFASGISYQPNGLIDTVVHGNGVSETWIPDPNGITRPCAIFAYSTGVSLLSNTGGSDPACSHSLAGGPGNAVKFGSGAYAFDASGNIKAIGAKTYTYDGVSRFTASNNGESVVYDVYGNITNHTGQAGNVDSTTNRLTTATYDDAGNVTAINTDTSSQTSTWDALSMMQSVRAFSKAPHSVSGHPLRDASFLYDPDDERIAVVDNPSGDLVASLRSVTTYTLRAFDPHLLRSYTDDARPLDNPQPPNSEVWTLKEDEIWRGSQLLALATGDGYVAHYTLDHLGSPATITDSDGLGSTPIFDPFGTGGVNFGALQFTGHERDQGAGLDYMHARFYAAAGGRFLSVDPMLGNGSRPQSWNRYCYVSNNPMNMGDPTGLCGEGSSFIGPVAPCEVTLAPPRNAASWTAEQRAAENAKNAARAQLAEQGKLRVNRSQVRPSSTQVAKANGGAAPEGSHLDHKQELVLDGAPLDPENIAPLDETVNVSNGSRVGKAVAPLSEGTVITRFNYSTLILSWGGTLTVFLQGYSYAKFMANQEAAHPGDVSVDDMARWVITGNTKASPPPCGSSSANPC